MSWLNRLRKEQQVDEVAGRAEHGGDLTEYPANRLNETLAEEKQGRLELTKAAAGRIYDALTDAGAKLIGDMATSIRHELIERPTYGRAVTPEKVEIGVHGAPEGDALERTAAALEKTADALEKRADAPTVEPSLASPSEGLTDADKRWLEHAMEQHERRASERADLYGPDVDGPESAGMDR